MFQRLSPICFAVLFLLPGIMNVRAVAQTEFASESDELFVFRPNTPERQVRGAILAEKLDRPGLAQGYLAELMEAQPSTEELQELKRKFGIGVFLKLSAIRELQPQSRELLQIINEAGRAEVASVSTIELLISELGQSKQQTVEASLKILAAEGDAVLPLLAADRSTPEGELADLLLQKYVRRFRQGLLTALPDATDATRVRILQLLAGCADPEIVPDLIPYRFSESAAVVSASTAAIQQLKKAPELPATKQQAVDELLQHSLTLVERAGGNFPTLQDHADDRRLQAVLPDQPVVYGVGFLQRAVALAALAEQISPESADVLAVKLTAELAEQSWPAAWPADVTLPAGPVESAQVQAVDVLALQAALTTQNPGAILSQLRRSSVSAAVLHSSPEMTRQLLMHSDARVRLLAAALVHESGGENYRAHLALVAAVSGKQKPEAVVIDTRQGEAPTVAAVLDDAGYTAESSRTGQGGFELAVQAMHCELIMVHSNCLRWPLSQTLANLRADYRTRGVPIIVYGPERDRSRTELTRSGHEGIWFLAEPVSNEVSNFDAFLGSSGRTTDPTIVIERFRLEAIPQPVLSEDERRQMIQLARGLL